MLRAAMSRNEDINITAFLNRILICLPPLQLISNLEKDATINLDTGMK